MKLESWEGLHLKDLSSQVRELRLYSEGEGETLNGLKEEGNNEGRKKVQGRQLDRR